jgi:hypothetical protein
MPSLIYIARIRNLSDELAKSLRAAGCHVKSFKPGDITQDECLLAMTSEAVGAALHPEGDRAEAGRMFAGNELGSQAASWNSIKTAVAKESQSQCEQVASVVSPVASTEESEAIRLSFTPTGAARRTVSGAQDRVSGENVRIGPPQIIAVSSAEISRTPKNVRPTKEQLYRIFRNPLSTVVALLLCSVVYRGFILPSTLPSTTGITIPRKANYTPSDSDSANSLLTASASPGRPAHRSTPERTLSSAELPLQGGARLQRRPLHDDSMAEDFTNHFNLHARSGATRQDPELKNPQSGSIRKRIVVD